MLLIAFRHASGIKILIILILLISLLKSKRGDKDYNIVNERYYRKCEGKSPFWPKRRKADRVKARGGISAVPQLRLSGSKIIRLIVKDFHSFPFLSISNYRHLPILLI